MVRSMQRILSRAVRILLVAFAVGRIWFGAAESTAQDRSLLGLTSCCPNEVVRFDPASGDTETIVQVGTEGDRFVATVGSGIVGDGRIFLVRNDSLLSADLKSGVVNQGPPIGRIHELIAFDDGRKRILAFTGCCPNEIVELDPSTGDQDVIVEVGTAERKLEDVFEHRDEYGNVIHRDSVWIYEGDMFGSVAGPAIASSDARHLFLLRNDRLLSVDTEEASVSEGPRMEDMQLLAYSEADRSLFLFTNCCPNRILEYSLDSGRIHDVAVAGTGRNILADVIEEYDEVGNLVYRDSLWMFEGDMFRVSFGIAAYDESTNTIFLNRNRRLVSVAVSKDAEVVESDMSGAFSIVGFTDAVSGVFREELPAIRTAEIRAVPNPLARTGSVWAKLERDQEVAIDVIDLLGRTVLRLHAGHLTGQHWHHFSLDPSMLPSGTYYIRLLGASVISIEPLVVSR